MGRGGTRGKRRRGRKEPAGAFARLGRILREVVLGREVDEDTSAHLQEIKGLALGATSIWLLLSMATYFTPYYGADGEPVPGRNWGGQAGFYLANFVFLFVGWAGYLLGVLGLAWGGILLARKKVVWPTLRILGGVCLLLSTAFLLQLAFGAGFEEGWGDPARRGDANRMPYGPGGWLALKLIGPDPTNPGLTPLLVVKFGRPGLWILLVSMALISFMLATEMAFYPAIRAFQDWADERRRERGEGVLVAVGGWAKRFGLELWDFLRGRDLEELELEPAAPRRAARRAPATTGRGAPEPDDADEEDLIDEDEEWEYVDEDGNPIEADELEEYAWDEVEAGDGDEWDEEAEPGGEELEAPSRPPARPAVRAQSAAPPPGSFEPPTPPPGPWKFPPIDLLEPPAGETAEDQKRIEAAATKLENALRSFRVEASVVGARVGPTVTLFELEVAEGTRMNKVTQLASEIAAALRARSVRIIAPIPGKSTIGVEVPNSGRRIVRLSELVHQRAYDKNFAALPLFLGMDTEGNAIVENLARMPHLLIAGTTGSGKSVCINCILASLLLTRSPHDVQLILIDPKMVELMQFARVPHLMLPVVTDARQATNVLLWATEKMEGRYDLFRNAKVRDIKTYNALSEDELRQRLGDDWSEERTPRHIPYIVIVIDEMADLMMVSKKEAEQAITRLAQKSRAVGIHVIVATQRPSTDVITGVLKGNLPTRVAFQVASKVDSRVILDAVGAEKLLGQGDMLYTPPQSSQIKRVQGAFLEEHEMQALVDFVCEESAPHFSQELIQAATGAVQPGEAGSGAAEDELWDEAVRVILKSRRGSASLLQRALGIGYTRASRLIDLMTAEGIVGEHKGSKAREVLWTLEDWESAYGAPAGAPADPADMED